MLSTSVKDIPAKVEACREFYRSGKTLSAQSRLDNLNKLVKMMQKYEPAMVEAMHKDLGKPKNESIIMDCAFVNNEAWTSISHLREWMSPQHVAREGVQYLDTCYTLSQPLGTVLIIGAFNYPVQLLAGPLVGALAAGNTVVVKPSEVSQHTCRVITEAIEATFPSDLVSVVNGAKDETTALLKERFDYIFYTGGCRVGKVVQAAASEFLTPCTLELGGKSPTYIDASANIPVAARRIIWGRCVNAGQTCVAPDYCLAHKSIKDELIKEMGNAITSFYGQEPKNSADFGRIISDMHFERIKKLMEGGKVVHGGQTDAATRFIAPTVLDNVDVNSALMKEEIFGPLLPVIGVDNHREAIDFINAREKPLAMYIFSTNNNVTEEVNFRTTAGGVTVNDTLMHGSVETLPFGGVGNSGMGAYHGKLSYDTFSHKKAVLIKGAGMEFANQVRYPPYTDQNLSLIKGLLFKSGPKTNTMFYFAVGAVVTAAFAVYWQFIRKKSAVV